VEDVTEETFSNIVHRQNPTNPKVSTIKRDFTKAACQLLKMNDELKVEKNA